MTRAHPEAPATWYRLSDESWAEIAEAYRNGATARELAARWKVSPGSIYRHACAGGWTKKRSADAVARQHAAAIAEEEAADEAWLTRPPPEPVEATPAAMRERALRDMSRALAAGRHGEALALVRLVEGLARLEHMAPAGEDDGQDDEEIPEEARVSSSGMEYLADRLLELRVQANWPHVKQVAEQMLADVTHPPFAYSRVVRRWRAQNLGPEVAEADRQAMAASPHYGVVYDEAGRVRDGWRTVTGDKPIPPDAVGFDEEMADRLGWGEEEEP